MDIAIVEMERYGDIMIALPMGKYLADMGHHVFWIVKDTFKDILDGVSYVTPVVWTGRGDDPKSATEWAQKKFQKVITTHVNANPYNLPDGYPYFIAESFVKNCWTRAGLWHLYDSLPLVFDRRSPEREAKLLASRKDLAKPLLLLALSGWASPFSQREAFKNWIMETRSGQYEVLDISEIRSDRVYDLLGLYDVASALISIDSGPLHLANASKVPVIGLQRDDLWGGAAAKARWALALRYNEALTESGKAKIGWVLDHATKPGGQNMVTKQFPEACVFGTMYAGSHDAAERTRLWISQVSKMGCDWFLVDSDSPKEFMDACQIPAGHVIQLGNNIGHLAGGGQDGWGRAFCMGLQFSMDHGYKYAFHIESDLLCHVDVAESIAALRASSDPVVAPTTWFGVIETGLMLMDVGKIKELDLIARYDWQGKHEDLPELRMGQIVRSWTNLWQGGRNDDGRMDTENPGSIQYITHGTIRILRSFAGVSRKLNLGCGGNRPEGWANFDTEMDIAKPLRFTDGSTDLILAEHVIEHLTPAEVWGFFNECRRILCPGGIIRICIPDVAKIAGIEDGKYRDFIKSHGWGDSPVGAILCQHGHKSAWTAEGISALLQSLGFKAALSNPDHSKYPELDGVDGHHKAIGREINEMETSVIEGVRP